MFDARYFSRGGSPPHGPQAGPQPGAARGCPTGRWRRRLAILAVAAALPVAVLAQAAPAFAVVNPQVTITCTDANNCTANGTGFTPGGQVQVQALAGSTVISSSSLTASPQTQECDTSVKPTHCYRYGGGTFSADLPADYNLVCNATAAGTMQYTNVANGVTVSKPVTWTGPCVTPTTTTLSLPKTMDTGWSATNPASVTAGSAAVTSGTITITVNGAPACSYTAGTSSGCTLASLPAGTDQIQASYAGSTIPPYNPSSASATVTVVPVQPTWHASSQNWAGYVATGGTYTTASADWTVPAANCAWAAATTSATWVGIDGGDGGSTVEQIGTDSNCTAFNASYWAWYQMVPNGPVIIDAVPANAPVFPGDSMHATVSYTGTPGTYELTIQDNTANWSYSTTQSVSGATGGTAECVEERPSAAGLPLANFGTVTFTGCQAAAGTGPLRPIWDYQNQALDMISAGSTPLAKVSALSDDGTQFSVTWQNGS